MAPAASLGKPVNPTWKILVTLLGVVILSLGLPGLPVAPLRIQPASASVPDTTTRASVSSEEAQAIGFSVNPSITADGHYVAFDSTAENLVSGDSNVKDDVFVRDQVAGTTVRVSVGYRESFGEPNNGHSTNPSVSANGVYVAFQSSATNLIDYTDANGVNGDVFVWDSLLPATTLISSASPGVSGNAGSGNPSISADGQFVAFDSNATDLVGGDINLSGDVFRRDQAAPETKLVSVTAPPETQGNSNSYDPSISADGRYVAFTSNATNLGPLDTNDDPDVYRKDMVSGEVKMVSLNSTGQQEPEGSSLPAISADGRYVAFMSNAHLTPEDTNSNSDVYIRDVDGNKTTLISIVPSGQDAGNGNSQISAVTSHGRYVAFDSAASDLLPPPQEDTNNLNDVFVRGVPNQLTVRSSISYQGAQSSGGLSALPAMSYDGVQVAFESAATNLVAELDTNSATDIFVRRAAVTGVPDSQTFGLGSGAHSTSTTSFWAEPVNSATGAYVTSATDLSLPGIGVPFILARVYNSNDTTPGVLGPGWTHSYNLSLTVQQPSLDVLFRAEDGQQLLFARQADGTYLPPMGGRTTLTAAGIEWDLLRHDQVKYHFDSLGRVTSIKDRNNQGLTLAYVGGSLSTITDSVGRQITFNYVGGLLDVVQLPDGRNVDYGYTSGNLSSVRDARGLTMTYGYSGGKLVDIFDQKTPPRRIVHNTYGGDGRISEQLDAYNKPSTFSWDAPTETATFTDALTHQWKDEYANNVLIKRTDPLNNVTTYAYDDDLNLVAVTDPRGNTWTMSYDDRGNLLLRIAPPPLLHEEKFTYDSKNNLKTYTDGRTKTTSYDYDTPGNLTKFTRPANIITEFIRDPGGTGLLTRIIDPRGKNTDFEYDQGNLKKITTHLQNKTTFGYDPSGRMTSMVDPRGNAPGGNQADYTWAYEYDNANNLRKVTDPLGNITEYTWDAVGNLKTRKDANLHVLTYGYDDNNRLTTVTPPDPAILPTIYTYDDVGNLKTRKDAKLHVTNYAYDNANRLFTVTSPTQQVWTHTYDGAGNLRTLVMPSGGTITYTHDEMNRLKVIDYSDSTPDVTFDYDANSNRITMDDVGVPESYGYDDLNRLTSVTRGSDVFSYEYADKVNLTKRTYPDGTVIDFAYDDDERLASTVSGGATTTYLYDEAANLKRTTLPAANGYRTDRIYDRAGRLKEVKNIKGTDILSRFNYTVLDPVGNPKTLVTSQGTITYNYDLMDRLTQVCFGPCGGGGDPYINYTYDGVGNRTTEVRASGTTTYNYNDSDQLTSKTNTGGGLVTYTYDLNGNQASANLRTFTYDLENRLTSTTLPPNPTVTYIYDGADKRLQESSGSLPSQKTNYLWDPNASMPLLALERDGNNALRRRYLYGGDDLLSMFTGGASYYYHPDGLGSVANLTSGTGIPQWTYIYEPFGPARTTVQNDPAAPTNLMRFTGQLLDTSTGLYHLRARQYDPANGRFLHLDPLPPPRLVSYLSSYIYAQDRPTVLVDPSGMGAEESEMADSFLAEFNGFVGDGWPPDDPDFFIEKWYCVDGFYVIVQIFPEGVVRTPTNITCDEDEEEEDEFASIFSPVITTPLPPSPWYRPQPSYVDSLPLQQIAVPILR